MRILVFNQDWFVSEFRAAGHEVVTCGLSEHLDVPFAAPVLSYEAALKQLPAGFEPDLVLVHDNSAPVIIHGLERVACPTVFYAVDTHHHTELHCYLSHLFDYTLIAQKDYLPDFAKRGCVPPEWMPLWASQYVEPVLQKEYGAVFVGTLNPRLNPGRVKFFDALKQRIPLLCLTGEWWKIFPRSQLVINQTVKGDLNFRVFEAMICGAALLTEQSGNGLNELFVPGRHLFTYEKDNVDQAAAIISDLMSDLPRCRAVAEAGRAEILRSHMIANRAARMLEVIQTCRKRESRCRWFGAMINQQTLSFRLRKLDLLLSQKALIEGMRILEEAMQRGEEMTDEISFYAVWQALDYDRLLKSRAGSDLLQKLHEAYPDQHLLAAAALRDLLNSGQMEKARALARRVFEGEPEEAFKIAEESIAVVLNHIENESD